jgi:hypothetical protein
LSGDRIERLTLHQTGGKGEVTVAVVDDFASARAAIASFAWPDAPFSRARMRAALGLDRRTSCCEDTAGLGVPQKDNEPPLPLPVQAVEFQNHCAACHRTPERSPPNFLAGDTQRVTASLAQCAPRILRFGPWQTPAARDSVPMPPPPIARRQSVVQTAPDPTIAAPKALSPIGCARKPVASPMPRDARPRLRESRPCLPPDA